MHDRLNSKGLEVGKSGVGGMLRKMVVHDRIHSLEFKSELRHRFYVELKASYWHSFEEGLAYPSTVIRLDTSVNRAMDHTHEAVEDFKFIEQSLPAYSFGPQKLNNALLRVPLLGGLVRFILFQNVLNTYDILVNFISGRKMAIGMLDNLYAQDEGLDEQEQGFVSEIKQEIYTSIVEAEKYLRENVITMWPEVTVAANQHRTAYSVLVQQKNYVNRMHDEGQVDDA